MVRIVIKVISVVAIIAFILIFFYGTIAQSLFLIPRGLESVNNQYDGIVASVPNILSKSIQENIIIWFVITIVISPIIAAFIKYISEQYLPQRGLKRKRRIAIQKYSYPLGNATYELCKKISNLLSKGNEKKFDDPTDNFYRLSTLYFFGSFFGWSRILEREAFLEYSEHKDVIKSKRMRKFNSHYYMTVKVLSNESYFDGTVDFGVKSKYSRIEDMYKQGDYASDSCEDMKIPGLVEVESATVERLILSAIGDVMIDQSEKTVGISPNVISFAEFVSNYTNRTDFQRWFSYLQKVIAGLSSSPSNARRNILFVFLCNLTLFMDFINKCNYLSLTDYVNYYLSRYFFTKRYYYLARIRLNQRRSKKEDFPPHFSDRKNKPPHIYLSSLHPVVRKKLYYDYTSLRYSRKKVNEILFGNFSSFVE